MKYFSLNRQSSPVSFQEAVFNGLAPDKGLYFPESIPNLPKDFIDRLDSYSDVEIAYRILAPFIVPEIPETELQSILEDTLSFPFPIVKTSENTFALELFHGPTMAFKDVGARFMARCLAYFNRAEPGKRQTVLVATSGDTGGAVAAGFLGVEGVDVVILYPSGKVSDIQEKQLTTLGQNITALEVDGVFDDCQDMVKRAFLDPALAGLGLTSANSINVARWLPQMIYFFSGNKQLKQLGKPIAIACPSGNFGNICAGVLAKKMGLPIARFVAATNANDTVPRFFETGLYDPKPSVATLSNAMDVGNPSNFIRIRELYGDDLSAFSRDFTSYPFTDVQTRDAMRELFSISGYVADPHGAVGYLGLKKELEKHPEAIGAFLETAHPVKFLEEVENTVDVKVAIPPQIQSVMDGTKASVKIADYAQLKRFLLS